MKNDKNDDTLDFDGVIYSPDNKNKSNSFKTKNIKRKTAKKLDKSQFKLFYGATIAVGLVVCIVVFAIVFNFMYDGGSHNTIASDKLPTGENILQDNLPQLNLNEKQSITAVVTRLNYNNNIVAVMDIDNNIQYSLAVNGNTVLKNKSSQSMSLTEVKVGDVVDVVFEEQNKLVSSLKISGSAWENRLVQNVNVTPQTNEVSFSNNVFKYDDNVIVTYGGEEISIEDISPIDFVTLRGIDKKIVFIDVNRSHGAVQIINQNNIINGKLEINTDIFMPLTDANIIEVLEGPNRVVIRGDNIEPFVRQINISRNETYILDLTESQLRTGVLTINASPKEITVLIDGHETSLDEPILLEYGEHIVRAERAGYAPWEGTVVIDRQSVRIDVSLVEIRLKGNLMLTSEPAEAQIYINNRYMGLTPVEIPLEYGVHTISVRKAGYIETNMDINITGSQVTYNVKLHEDIG